MLQLTWCASYPLGPHDIPKLFLTEPHYQTMWPSGVIGRNGEMKKRGIDYHNVLSPTGLCYPPQSHLVEQSPSFTTQAYLQRLWQAV